MMTNFIDLTEENNPPPRPVTPPKDLPRGHFPIELHPEDELGGEYPGMDISSLNR